MSPPITASILYDLVQCPRRVALDLFGDPAGRDEISPFVKMLWERGSLYERDVIEGGDVPLLDLSHAEGVEKERLTLEAMRRGEPLIYGGRIAADDLVGIPDLLRRRGGGYIPIDIKSGRGEEGGGDDGEGDGKPKLHYAVQLALYVDILERLGLAAGRYGIILDVRGEEVTYDLAAARGVRKVDTLWDEYQVHLASARAIAEKMVSPKGALASACKLCHWYSACSTALTAHHRRYP